MRILVFLFVFIPFFCHSSDLVTVKMGPIMKEDHKHHLLLLYKLSNQIILIKSHINGKTNPIAEIIDAQLKVVNSKQIKIFEEKENIEIIQVTKYKNELLFFCKNITNTLNPQFCIYHLPSNNLDEKPKVEILKTWNDEINFKRSVVHIDFSADTSKFVVYFNHEREQNHEFLVFNQEWKQLYKLDFQLNKRNQINTFKINNKGNLFIETIGDNHEFNIYSYNHSGQLLSQRAIQNQLTQLKYIASLDSNLIFSGIVHDIQNNDLIVGVHLLSYNYYSNKIITNKTTLFDSTTCRYFVYDEEQLKNISKRKEHIPYGIFDLKLVQTIPRSDGGAGLICEQQNIKEETRTYFDAYGMMRSYTIKYFLYNNIACINVNPNGSIEWIKKIPKKQETANDDGMMSSFSKKLTPNFIYFIFNDHIQNSDNSKNPLVNVQNFDFTRYTYSLALYRINIKGELEWQRCLTYKNGEVFTTPSLLYQLSPTEIFFIGKNGKKERYGILKEIQEN